MLEFAYQTPEMPRCCVFGCSNTTNVDLGMSVHKFPNRDMSPNRFKAWRNRINRRNFVPTRSSVVCSEHFIPEDFEITSRLKNELLDIKTSRRILKKNALPSLKLKPSEHFKSQRSCSAHVKKITCTQLCGRVYKEPGTSDIQDQTDNDDVSTELQCQLGVPMESSNSHEVYIKQEPWCQSEASITVKSEESVENRLISKMVSYKAAESKNNFVHCNEQDTKIKMEIKTESPWIQITPAEMSCKTEFSSESEVDLQNDIKTMDEIAEDTSRLCTESMCTNSNDIFTNTELESGWEKIEPDIVEKSKWLNSTQSKLEPKTVDSEVKGCNYKASHQCEICAKGCKVHSRLKRHLTSHEGTKAFKCEICEKTYSRASTLSQHKLTHTGIRPYSCEICNRSFFRKSHMKEHKLIHDGNKPHICEICNSSFTLISYLNKHKLIHNVNKTHTCEVCSKSFTQAPHLKKHKLIHENKRPHVCGKCNMSFILATSLKRHTLIHQDNRRHACDICNKTFTLAQNLRQHKLIHEGKQPHKCHVCSKRFTRTSDLKKHKAIHEGKRLHSCHVCSKSFTLASTLKRHKLLVHKEERQHL